MSVFLQGLDRNANDAAIQELFTNLSIDATIDRQNNKRFAIVQLADESQIEKALEGLNGKEFEGATFGKMRASKYEQRERKEKPEKNKTRKEKKASKNDEADKKAKKAPAKKGKKAAKGKKDAKSTKATGKAEATKTAGTKGEAFLKRLKRDLKKSGGEKLCSITYDEETDSLVVGLFQRNKAKTLYVNVE
jgi:hypothetical protein